MAHQDQAAREALEHTFQRIHCNLRFFFLRGKPVEKNKQNYIVAGEKTFFLGQLASSSNRDSVS